MVVCVCERRREEAEKLICTIPVAIIEGARDVLSNHHTMILRGEISLRHARGSAICEERACCEWI